MLNNYKNLLRTATMIESFKTMRMLPKLGSTLYIITIEKKQRFYALLPDDAEMSRDTIKQYRISSTLFDYLLTI